MKANRESGNHWKCKQVYKEISRNVFTCLLAFLFHYRFRQLFGKPVGLRLACVTIYELPITFYNPSHV